MGGVMLHRIVIFANRRFRFQSSGLHASRSRAEGSGTAARLSTSMVPVISMPVRSGPGAWRIRISVTLASVAAALVPPSDATKADARMSNKWLLQGARVETDWAAVIHQPPGPSKAIRTARDEVP